MTATDPAAAPAGAGGPLLVGTVVSAGWPVPSATVTVVRSGGQVGRATSDDLGAFSLPVEGPGPATLVVAAPGHTPLARAVLVPAGRLDIGALPLDPVTSSATPPPGRWEIDPVHSLVRATARHLAMSRVEGRFTQFSGSLTVTPDPLLSSAEVDIVAASIDTGNADRDAHLRSPDFLDAEHFPVLTYRSTGVRAQADDRWTMDGLLTIRDIARPVALDVRHLGTGPDPWGGTRSAFVATAQLARRDWDMTWNMGLPSGLVLVGPTLRIDLEVQAVATDT